MIDINIIDYSKLLAFWLCFIRWLAMIVQLPLFDNLSIPSLVKVLSALIVTYAFFPYISSEMLRDIHYIGEDNFWLLTIFNALVGLAIGFIVKSIMNIFVAAGAIITQQIGFAAINYFDPTNLQRVGPFEILIQWTMLIIVLSSGALLPMFKGANSTFFSIHIYDLGKLGHSADFLLNFFKSIFLSALMLSSPLIFTNILIMIVLGIISRTVPQMNVLMMSFVVSIGMGLLVFAASSEEFFTMGLKIYTKHLGEWFQMVN